MAGSLGFLRRHHCLTTLLLVIVVAAVAAIWALFFAPDKIRQATLSVEKSAKKVAQFLPASLPPPTRIDAAHWLPQNWSERDRYWFHHTPQGTATIPIPLVWFLALERPEISLSGHPGYIRDEAFIRRLGFIPSPDVNTLRRRRTAIRLSQRQNGRSRPTTERDQATGYPDNAFGCRLASQS